MTRSCPLSRTWQPRDGWRGSSREPRGADVAATSQALPGADTTNRAANKPVVVGRNALELLNAGAISNLVSSTVGTLAAGDGSAAGHDRKYLIDRFKHTFWLAGSTSTDWYIAADLGTTPQWWDVVILSGLIVPTGTTLTVEGDTTNTPAVPWTGASVILNAVALPVVPAGQSSAIFVNFQAANQWQSRYVRLHLNNALAFAPQIGECWLGNSVQFPVKRDYGSASVNAQEGGGVETETGTGILADYGIRGSRYRGKLNFNIPDSDLGTFLQTNMKDWFRNMNSLDGGRRCFWYVEDPTANPTGAIFVKLKNKVFDPLEDSPLKTKFSMDLMEQGGGS